MARLQPVLSRHTEANTTGNGTGQNPLRIGTGAQPCSRQPASYSVREAPFGTPRSIRVITLGAGASGLNMIRTLRNTLAPGSFSHVVYEKNRDVGGTWQENRYPGCRCDVPSHSYQFSWRKNPEWSNFFAAAEEIQEYLSNVCEEEEMRPIIKTAHKVLGAYWDEENAEWAVTIRDLDRGTDFTDWADFLIDATGILNKWKMPDIPGLGEFRGDLIHTAHWPKGFDHRGLRVAVIGNGASGVQVLPALLPDVEKLYHIIRTPTAIFPPRVATMKTGALGPMIAQLELDDKENFSPAQIAKFKSDPYFYDDFTEALELDSNTKFAIALMKDSPQQKWASGKVREYMASMLRGNEKLCAQLIPDFPLGCRRMTPAPGYLESFHDPKVELLSNPIKRITRHGIELENGDPLDLDAIVCATGFDNTFRPPFPIVGRRGNLQDVWTAETPRSYMSLAVDGLPNYFKFLGPGAPIAHGAVFTLSEHIANYIAAAIRKAQTEGIRTLVPSRGAVEDYAAHIAAFMPRTAFSGACSSWYKHGEDVVGLHPGSRMHFIEMLSRSRGEDWEFTYHAEGACKGNRFAYLGNGFTKDEMDMMKKAAVNGGGS